MDEINYLVHTKGVLVVLLQQQSNYWQHLGSVVHQLGF